MSFAWSSFLDLAWDLASEAPQSTSAQLIEARRRSAISRAYYAAFCSARKYVQGRPEYSYQTERTDHLSLWNGFLKQTDNANRAIGIIGTRLRGARVKADYNDETVIGSSEVMRDLTEASDILKSLRQLPQ